MEAIPTHVRHSRIFSALLLLVAVFTWTSCGTPVKSKRQSLQRPESKSSYLEKPVRGEEGVRNPADTFPTAHASERRRILPLREEMERMQEEQHALSSRIDSIQDQVRGVQTSMQSLQKSIVPRSSQNTTSNPPSSTVPSRPTSTSAGSGVTQEPTNKTLPVLAQRGINIPQATDRPLETRPTPGNVSDDFSDVIHPDQEDTAEEIPSIPRRTAPRRRNVSQSPKRTVAPRFTTATENPQTRPSNSPKSNLEQRAAAGNRADNAGRRTSDIKAGATSGSTSGSTSVATSESDGISFTKAMELFKRKQFQDCLSVLSALNSKSASTEGIAKNNYWIGESYFGLARYDEAIRSFKKTLIYSSSEKSAAAQFMIAESYLKMGKNGEAKRGYERVAKLYPQSSEAVRALKRLQQI